MCLIVLSRLLFVLLVLVLFAEKRSLPFVTVFSFCLVLSMQVCRTSSATLRRRRCTSPRRWTLRRCWHTSRRPARRRRMSASRRNSSCKSILLWPILLLTSFLRRFLLHLQLPLFIFSFWFHLSSQWSFFFLSFMVMKQVLWSLLPSLLF